jgi:hypothetical protein
VPPTSFRKPSDSERGYANQVGARRHALAIVSCRQACLRANVEASVLTGPSIATLIEPTLTRYNICLRPLIPEHPTSRRKSALRLQTRRQTVRYGDA